MFRLSYIKPDSSRVTKLVPAERLNAAIDSAFDDDQAQFLTIKKVPTHACAHHA